MGLASTRSPEDREPTAAALDAERQRRLPKTAKP